MTKAKIAKIVEAPVLDAAEKKARQMKVAKYIEHQLEIINKPQTEIALEAGFEQTNMVSMLKKGSTKLSLKRVPAFARAIGVDPRFLFAMCINAYLPEAEEAILEILNQPILTSNELEMIQIMRDANPNNPKVRSRAQEDALRNFVISLSAEAPVENVADEDENS